MTICRALLCMYTAMFCATMCSAKGMNSSAMPRRTSRGSAVAASICASAMRTGGGPGTAACIAAMNSSCFDSKCRSTAAAVTPSTAAMSASVAASNPFSPNTRRAA